MKSLSVALRAGYLSVRTAEGVSEKQSSLKARLRNGCTYLLTYLPISSHRPTHSSENFLFKSVYDIDIDIDTEVAVQCTDSCLVKLLLLSQHDTHVIPSCGQAT